MTLNDLILKIKLFEGFSIKVYIDAGGTPTIGYGGTNIKSMDETISACIDIFNLLQYSKVKEV